MDEYIIGIDIGSSKVCAAAGKLDKQGNLQIAGVTSASCTGLKKGIIVDIEAASKSIGQCIEQLARMIDKEVASVYISLPGGISELVSSRGVIAISSEDHEIRKNDIIRVLNAAKIMSVPSNKEIVGVIPNEFIIDGYDSIKDPIGMSGLKLEVDAHVVLAQSTIVNNLVKSVKNLGLRVNGIVLEPSAIAQVALKRDELKMGAVLLDAGLEKIDISVYKDGNIVHTDMLPLGGSTITNDLSICLKIPYSSAEKLKLKYGSVEKKDNLNKNPIKASVGDSDFVHIDYSTLVDIIEARVDEILHLIKSRLEQHGYLEEVSSIVIVGGGLAFLDGICELGRNIFIRPVRIAVPEHAGSANPMYNTAVGIVKDATSTLNITQTAQSSKETYKHKEDKSYEKTEDSEENGVLSKIKGFLADFF
jgi:cell division protein FtsA